MRTKIHEIPEKLLVEWDSEGRAIIDTWISYYVTLEEFKNAVFIKGVDFGEAHGAIAWIVDSHNAKGTFSPEIQEFIESTVFPKFKEIGIKYFMTINSSDAITRLAVNEYSFKAEPSGLKLLKGSSVKGALEWLKKKISLEIL